MKSILCGLLLLSRLVSAAQEIETRYYTTDGERATKEKSAFYAEIRKSGAVYACTSYLTKNGALRGHSDLYGYVPGEDDRGADALLCERHAGRLGAVR